MKKILIVEDEIILGEMYKDKFEQAGLDVVLVESAEKALEITPKVKPDLILLDILLPKENGIYFLNEIKNRPEFSNIPIIAFSNYDDVDTKKEAYKLGVKEYLIKTAYTPQEIIEKVKNYL